MKLGMNMMVWSGDVTGARYQPVFEMLADAGYEGIELPVFGGEPAAYADAGRRIEALGLERLALTGRGEADNPASADAAVRAAGVAANVAAVECAAAAGATILCGPFHVGVACFTGAGPTADELRWAAQSLHAVAEVAGRHGITLAIESLDRFEMHLTNTTAQTSRLVRAVGHPDCRMMYDTFHANIEEKDIRAAIHTCADVLAYVHVSENDRSTPGTGQVDWDATFAALGEIGYDGWYTVEAFGTADPALVAALRTWRRGFDTEEQLARDAAAFVRARVAPTPTAQER